MQCNSGRDNDSALLTALMTSLKKDVGTGIVSYCRVPGRGEQTDSKCNSLLTQRKSQNT